MIQSFDSLGELVRWLASVPGAVVAVGFFVSYVLERFSFWHKIPKDVKGFLSLVLAYGVSWLAQEYLSRPVVLGNSELNQTFLFLTYYLSSQVAYRRYFKV